MSPAVLRCLSSTAAPSPQPPGSASSSGAAARKAPSRRSSKAERLAAEKADFERDFRRDRAFEILNNLILARDEETSKWATPDSERTTDADVDQKMADIKAEINGKVAKIESDPNRQPIKVYTLLEINLPVDSPDPQLLQSRAIEASQIVSKFKSCATAKSATAGIFNVKIGKQIEADGRKLPPPMKQAFDKGGVGKAVGPVRSPTGIQVLGFCGTRVVTPPKLTVAMPTRDQVKTLVSNQKFDDMKVKYTAILRKSAVIEYKDPAFAQ